MKGIGLYGNGMHDFILRELEVGFRVAVTEDSEDCGFGPLDDLHYHLYLLEHDPEYAETHGRDAATT